MLSSAGITSPAADRTQGECFWKKIRLRLVNILINLTESRNEYVIEDGFSIKFISTKVIFMAGGF